jgi:plastocyanin
VVSAEGCVTIEVTDLSGTPLNAASEELCFGPSVECTVAVSPASPTVQSGGTQQFTATTTGEGCAEGSYTWAVSESTCTSSGSIDETGLYTAPGDVVECTETITATDTANGGAEGTATVTVSICTPQVNISPASATLEPGDTQTFTASTTCDGATLSGTYTWTVAGGTADTLSGDSIVYTAGSTEGSFDVTATDTANGDITATATVTIQEEVPPEFIEAEYTGVFGGSALFILPGQITIQGTGTDFTRFGSRVTYDSLLVFNYFKLVNTGTQTITQFVILWPSIIIPGQSYPATVTVTVDGLSDDVEIPSFP